MTDTAIHPSAVVEAGAELGAGVRVGPFCHVAAGVVIGDRVELKSHVSVLGGTTIGEGTVVWPHATLGASPQSFAHKGGPTTLVIGRNCTIREGVTMNLGTDNSRATTVVGDNGFFMAYSHVAHDCIVGDNVVMANQATLAGHCEVGNNVNIGGMTAVHQFVRIGHHAFIGGCSGLGGDVIPYGMAAGSRAMLRGFNIVGMKRAGMPGAEIAELRKAYRHIFEGPGSMAENAVSARAAFAGNALIVEIADFLLTRGRRYFCVPERGQPHSDDGGASE
jgi:UDP-N-acetylglucosamine acyltransferase